jgi:OOP family OmpA-OmpF porin
LTGVLSIPKTKRDAMNSKAKAALAILGLTSAIAVAVPASAQDTGFYVGASIGQSEAGETCTGVAGPGVSCDDKDTAWRILAGYQFNRNFAAEFGYTDLGEVSASGPGGSVSVETTAWELVGVGLLPLVDKFSAYGKIGLYRAETDATVNVPGFASASESNTDLTFGIGARYDFTRNLGVRAEWQRYQDVGGGDIGEDDVDVISIGVVWKF